MAETFHHSSMTLSPSARLRHLSARRTGLSNFIRTRSARPARSLNGVSALLLAEKVLAHAPRDQPRVLKLEVGALHLALVDGELLRELRGRGERVAGGEFPFADARFDLGAEL